MKRSIVSGKRKKIIPAEVKRSEAAPHQQFCKITAETVVFLKKYGQYFVHKVDYCWVVGERGKGKGRVIRDLVKNLNIWIVKLKS